MALLQSEMNLLRKGDSAPDFELKNIDGTIMKLSDFHGRPVAIVFICNHCPYVVPKMDELTELQSEEIPIILVNPNNNPNYPDDSFENMQKIAEEKRYKFYLFDETQQMAKDYGAVCTPDPFVFDNEHKLVYHGRINDAMNPDDIPAKHDLKEVLEKLKMGEQIENWFIPSQGCSIKWIE